MTKEKKREKQEYGNWVALVSTSNVADNGACLSDAIQKNSLSSIVHRTEG